MNTERNKAVRNIAITGSFASGKSYLINCLKNKSYKVFSCDDYIKNLYQEDGIRANIMKILHIEGDFSTSKIANVIYSDEQKKKILESYIHPLVRKGVKAFEQDNESEKIIFTEVPLLYETNYQNHFYKVICVYCSEETRWERAQGRGMKDRDLFEKLQNIQMTQEEKMKRADILINTDISIEPQLDDLINQINKNA